MVSVAVPTRIPTPKKLQGRTAVVLHAHPDDEAIFTAVTAHRLARAGARVVLVTATAGELGPVLRPLRAGETLAARRRAELEAACEVLGIARLVLLGHRDSGMAGWADNDHPDALAAADPDTLARRLAELCAAESAEALVHYDPHGIYGHPDHVAVHRTVRGHGRRGPAATGQAPGRPRGRRRPGRLGRGRDRHGRRGRRGRPGREAGGDGRARQPGAGRRGPPGRLRPDVRPGALPPRRRARPARRGGGARDPHGLRTRSEG